MKRQIVFVRHVSSPHPSGVSDFDRPIDDEGREDARRIAAHLESQGGIPRRVVVSSAERARETWESMEDGAGELAEIDVDFTRELYGAGIDAICELVWGLPAERSRVLLVGHNPGFSDVVSWSTGVRTRLPKGGIARVQFEGEDWSEALQQRSGELVSFVRPAELTHG